MGSTHIQLTKQGFEELQSDLQKLKVKEPQAIKRVAHAREHGDLSENSEYHAAREDLAFIQGKIEELEDILAQAKIISKVNKKSVAFGSAVSVVTESGDEVSFTIVGEYEADPAKKRISHDSPLGKALIGKKIDDMVEFEAPVGKVFYTIKHIS